MMTKPSLGARQGAMLRYLAEHPRSTTWQIREEFGLINRPIGANRKLERLRELGLLAYSQDARHLWAWDVTDAGWEWLATRADPVTRPEPTKRLVIGRKMRAVVAYVAKYEGCTKYAAGKAVTRPGHQRDGWVIVQRCIDAGLLSVRKRRDGTTVLSVTERGWVS